MHITTLWAIFVCSRWRPYAPVGLFISLDFFIFCLTSFCVCCFTLLFWHFLTFWLVQGNFFTSPFTGFYLLTLLLIIHSTFLFWNLFANLYLFCPAFFVGDLSAILDLIKQKYYMMKFGTYQSEIDMISL